MVYVLALKNSTWHRVASHPSYLCCIRGIEIVGVWHLVLLVSYCPDSDIVHFASDNYCKL